MTSPLSDRGNVLIVWDDPQLAEQLTPPKRPVRPDAPRPKSERR